jgi:predicted outer membrane repeat protein
MWFSSWLRKGKRDSARKPATVRPQLESLEERIQPSTWTVLNTLDDLFPGSLRAAINAAASGDTILFDSSLSGHNIALTGTELTINRNLTIQGPAGGLSISGGLSRVFEVDGATTNVTLRGLSLLSGNGMAYYPFFNGGGIGWSAGGPSSTTTDTPADGHGGAIWNGGVLTLDRCTLAYNSADVNYWGATEYLGGAVYNAGNLAVTNSTLGYNSAGDPYGNVGSGGGIYNGATGTLSVSNSTLQYNAAYHGDGGAIDNAGALAVGSSTFSGNYAFAGGAFFNGYGVNATITSCTFISNSASYGGAIWNSGTMTISGTASNPTTITGNTATAAGGGIFNAKQNGRLTITSSVVKNNTAPVGADLDNLGQVKISKDSTVGVIGH